MLLAIGITSVLYVLVALAAISVLGWRHSARPKRRSPRWHQRPWGTMQRHHRRHRPFSTANTMLLILVAASRMIYGMAGADALPRFLAWVHRAFAPPLVRSCCRFAVSVAFALSGDIGLVAGATNFAVSSSASRPSISRSSFSAIRAPALRAPSQSAVYRSPATLARHRPGIRGLPDGQPGEGCAARGCRAFRLGPRRHGASTALAP